MPPEDENPNPGDYESYDPPIEHDELGQAVIGGIVGGFVGGLTEGVRGVISTAAAEGIILVEHAWEMMTGEDVDPYAGGVDAGLPGGVSGSGGGVGEAGAAGPGVIGGDQPPIMDTQEESDDGGQEDPH